MTGPRDELARYELTSGVRALVQYGSQTTGSLWDEPVDHPDKAYLVERRVDCASLPHLIADYIKQSRRRHCPAMIVDLDFMADGPPDGPTTGSRQPDAVLVER